METTATSLTQYFLITFSIIINNMEDCNDKIAIS